MSEELHLFLALPNERIGGFGSTGRHIFWEMLIKDSHPVLSLIIQGKNFEELLDTGTSVSAISSQQWPQDWKKRKKPSTVDGTRL